jgi:hypothetical protein
MRSATAGLSGMVPLALLLPMEAGVPIPLPADLVMFTVGERVAAGRFPLWLAVAGFEVIAILGTTALFLACRGPGHRVIARFGPSLGLTEARVRRAAGFAETRGRTDRLHAGVLAGQSPEAGGTRGLEGGDLPSLHRGDAARGPHDGPGRDVRGGPGRPRTGRGSQGPAGSAA